MGLSMTPSHILEPTHTFIAKYWHGYCIIFSPSSALFVVCCLCPCLNSCAFPGETSCKQGLNHTSLLQWPQLCPVCLHLSVNNGLNYKDEVLKG